MAYLHIESFGDDERAVYSSAGEERERMGRGEGEDTNR